MSGDIGQYKGAMIHGQYAYYATPTYPYWNDCFSGTPNPFFAKPSNACGNSGEGRYSDRRRRDRRSVQGQRAQGRAEEETKEDEMESGVGGGRKIDLWPHRLFDDLSVMQEPSVPR